MSSGPLDELVNEVAAIEKTPIHRRQEQAKACFVKLMVVLHDFDRRLSELEGSACTSQTPAEI